MKQISKKAGARLSIAFALASSSAPILAQSSYSSSEGDAISGAVLILVLVIVALLIYFMPGIIAFRKHHPNRWPILLINTFFGGTGLGWLGSLIWALRAVHMSKTGRNGGESGLNIFANDPVHVKFDPDPFPTDDRSNIGEKFTRIKNLFEQNAITREEYDTLRKPLIQQLASSEFSG